MLLVRNKMYDCYQYADDRTFYIHSKPCDLDYSADHINKAVTSLRDYSKSCNLALLEFFQDKLDAYFHPSDGAIWQFRRTKTSYRLWRYSTKTNFLHKTIGCTRGPTPNLEDACKPWVKFIVRDTVSTAQALKSSPFSCEETPDRELSPL